MYAWASECSLRNQMTLINTETSQAEQIGQDHSEFWIGFLQGCLRFSHKEAHAVLRADISILIKLRVVPVKEADESWGIGGGKRKGVYSSVYSRVCLQF